jgi:DNA-binding response OmpR family regulator
VLIVEDDPVTLQQFTRFLKLEGFAVTGVADARSAMTIVNSQPPDAVVLDLHLPLVDGVECLRQIRRAVSYEIPVAIVTGDYFIDDAQLAAIAALRARIWYKPLWLDQLLDLVRALLAAQRRSDNGDLTRPPTDTTDEKPD